MRNETYKIGFIAYPANIFCPEKVFCCIYSNGVARTLKSYASRGEYCDSLYKIVLKERICSQRVNSSFKSSSFFFVDLILYVHSTIFQLCGTGLPGLNQY